MSFSEFFQGFAGLGGAYGEGLREYEHKSLLKQIGEQVQAGDYNGAAKAAFGAGDVGTGTALLKMGVGQQQARDANSAVGGLLGGMYGGEDAPQGGAPGGQVRQRSPTPSFLDAEGPSGGYLSTLIGKESGGSPTAKNPNSTATGLGQFTTGTWNATAAAHPDLGLTPDGRTDPEQSKRATMALAQDNGAALQKVGIEPTDGNLYVAHFLGAPGAKRFLGGMRQNPDAPASSYVDPAAVAANRSVFFDRGGAPKTAGQVYAGLTSRFGQGSTVFGGGEGGGPSQQAGAADMPAPGAQEAQGFLIPGGGSRMAGPGPSRGMTLPTEAGGPAQDDVSQQRAALSAQAPQHLADAGLPAGIARGVGALPAGSQKRALALGKVMSMPGVTEGQTKVLGMLMQNELEQLKIPDEAKQFIFARTPAGGNFQGSFEDWKRGPQTLAPGSSLVRGDRIVLTAPERDGGAYTLAPGQGRYDAGNQLVASQPDREKESKVSGDIEARQAAAGQYGLQPGTPDYQRFVLTGKMPGEDKPLSTASDRKAVIEADERISAAQGVIGNLTEAKRLSADAYSGLGAGIRGQVTSQFGNASGQATENLGNLVTTNALTSLKSIFGAAPTEGERAILLDIQGSVDKAPAVREAIYDRAIAAAQRRLGEMQQRSDEMRGGTFYKPGGGAATREPTVVPQPGSGVTRFPPSSNGGHSSTTIQRAPEPQTRGGVPIVPQQDAASSRAAQPSQGDLMNEARKRGLIR